MLSWDFRKKFIIVSLAAKACGFTFYYAFLLTEIVEIVFKIPEKS